MRRVWRVLPIFLFLALAACGTRDYGDSPETTSTVARVQEVDPSPVNHTRPVEARESRIGFLWHGLEFVGMGDAEVTQLQDQLKDTPRTRTFGAWGGVVAGGAVLGIVIRASGSWFFGGPIQSQAGHWFWKKVSVVTQGAAQGAIRGAGAAGACYLLLKGIKPLPYPGALGGDFTALSAATALGLTASTATATVVTRIMEANWTDPNHGVGWVLSRNQRIQDWAWKLDDWTDKSPLGRMVRFRLAPGILILGVGSGVGILVYDGLLPNSQ